MDSKVMAANILTATRNNQEHITAWETVLRRTVRPEKLAILRREVEAEKSLLRKNLLPDGRSYSQFAEQAEQEIADAADDTARIAVLESLILGQMDVSKD